MRSSFGKQTVDRQGGHDERTCAVHSYHWNDGRSGSPTEDRRHCRRLVGQSRRMVRLLRLRFHLDLFCLRLFPERRPDQPVVGNRRNFRRRLLHAAAGRMAVWLDRGYAWTPHLDGDVGAHDVHRVAADRRHAHLCDDRRRGASAPARCALGAGPFGGRRIRHRSDLHERRSHPRAIEVSIRPFST